MAEESKIQGSKEGVDVSQSADLDPNGKSAEVAEAESGDDDDEQTPQEAGESNSAGTLSKKKKKSKRKRIKDALTGASKSDKPTEEEVIKRVGNLSRDQISELLAMNPALAQELGINSGDLAGDEAVEAFKKLNLAEIMSGLAAGGKNVKDMASYKFWQTQPVPKFGEKSEIKEGPFKIIDPEQVPKEPAEMMPGFEWVTIDIMQEEQLKEVYELLNGHYVEDLEAMFRFNYSPSFLKWALCAPGWSREWHVGVRATQSKRLVAFISGVPISLRVRKTTVKATEINFLCVHKKLRSKRLAPVLIKEITRRCYLQNVYQAIYTAGVVLPTPFSTCRYFHRSLDWQKLYEVGFSPLPPNSKPAYQVAKYRLPDVTSTSGLRVMEAKDADQVLSLLKRYLARFDVSPVFTREEVVHWLIHDDKNPGIKEQVIWSYVVEDPVTKKITDYFSFYCLESTVIGNTKYPVVRAAYLFYYATETALTTTFDKDALRTRLNSLLNDALILAKRFKFDVFNALSLLDNTLFLEQQKFGKGDGQLHYYLYNYLTKPVAGGVDQRNEIDDKNMSGVGVVML